MDRWEKAVGPAIAKHTEVRELEKGVLRIFVDHPIWKSELVCRKSQILEKLNDGNDPESWLINQIEFIDYRKKTRSSRQV